MGYCNLFNVLWLGLGCIAIILGIFNNHIRAIIKRMKKRVKIPLFISISVGCLGFAIIEIQILYAMKAAPEQNADYVIILGARVNGTVPSLAMTRRTHAALLYLRTNKNAKVIVSGGQGAGEAVSEADAMAHILQNKGIGREHIILEYTSTNTFENLTYSLNFINSPDSRVVIVTSEFHVFRVTIIAKRLEYRNCTVLPSKTPLILMPHYMLREFLAILKDTITFAAKARTYRNV
jgi:uncharacterized SAM-binding protein YcdF (DUF218 family)